jgi:hypothetical protein
MTFTIDDIVTAFNSVGFASLDQAVASLAISNAFLEAGFTDPTILTPVLKRFKLINEQLALKTQAAALLAEQQNQVRAVVDATNPAIGELNNQVAAIDTLLAQLPAA